MKPTILLEQNRIGRERRYLTFDDLDTLIISQLMEKKRGLGRDITLRQFITELGVIIQTR